MAKKVSKINSIPIGAISGGDATDLTWIPSPTGVTIESSTGTDATGTLVDGTNWGLVSPDMKNTWDGKQDGLGYTPVTNARTITINGTSYDLTANRSWTVGDELISNKSDSYTVSSSTTYASTKALVDGLATKQDTLGFTPVTNARTLTINGTTFDLTANRSWTVGDVLTSGSYSNPSWITSLAWSKISGTPTTLAGYGITDAWKQGGNTLTAETILGGSSGAFGLNIQTNGLTAMKILSSPASAVNYLTVTSAIISTNPKLDTNNGSLDLLTGTTNAQLRLFGATNTSSGLMIYDGFASTYKSTLSANAAGSSRLQFGAGWSTFTFGGGNGFNLDISGTDCTVQSGTNFNIYKANSVMQTSSGITVTSGSTEYIAHSLKVTPGSTTYAPTGTNTSAVNMLKFIATFNQTVAGSGAITLIDTNSVTVTANVGQFTILRSNIAAGTGRYGLYIDNLANYLGGNTSIGTTTNTAFLTLGAATTAKASLRILAGAAPTGGNILDGNSYYDGSNLKFTVSTTDYTLAKTLTTSSTLDFPSVSANSYQDLTVTLTGAAVNDVVSIGVPNGSVNTNIAFFAWVSATDTITVRCINNDSSSASDPASGTFKISLQKI